MTFPIVMFVVGALMLAVGVLGKIQIREIVSEASGKTARIALTFAGGSSMVLACLMYRTEPPTLPESAGGTAGEGRLAGRTRATGGFDHVAGFRSHH